MPKPTPDKLQALERERLRLRAMPYLSGAPAGDAAPERATDTVIVKVRSTRGAARRIAVAAREIDIEGVGGDAPWLAKLIQNNLAERVTPVFRAVPVERAARGAMQAMAEAVREEQPVRAARGLVSIKVAPGVNASRLADHLNRQQDEFEYAYVPAIKYPCVARGAKRSRKPRTTNDTLSERQWAHGAIRIQQARARASFREAGDIVVAVLDSGIDKTHPDLVDVIDSYLNFLPNEDDRDYKGHGTHVAGIVAAEMNNGIGIAGVCAAKLMALKALPKRGNRWNAEAYYQALAHPIEAGVRVLNMSLGGGFDPGERDIIADLVDAGVAVVAAMGNEYEEGNPTSYPAAYPGVIAVGASDELDRRAAFSCTGAHIALVAPGERIISTTPMYPSEFAAQVGYDSWPGTSMATPHVAAAAALLLAKNSRMTPAQIRERLMSTADRTPSQQGAFDEAYGAGRLDIAGALR